MAGGVVIDTSFLITLVGKDRKHYDAALRYWRHFTENEVLIYLSTIVVSEFCLKMEIPEYVLDCSIELPFNWDDALCASKLEWKRERPPNTERASVKDDIKIIAQAAVREAEFVITDDSESFYRYCESFRRSGDVQFRAIKLEDGFDSAFFNPNGQRDIMDDLDDEEGE